MSDYSSIDALFARFVHDGGAPGIAYGVTIGSRLVFARALGTAEVGGARPPLDADSVFRIASMTKSFTAAAVLLLRDRGLVALDADIRTYLPEFNPAGAPAGSPPLTLRLLLSMNAGLPTDDPWGDRQESLGADAFGLMLSRGFSYNHAPGTRYEYSNLSYALAGRVVARISGRSLHEFVRAELLEPLGMLDSAFSAERIDAAHLAIGHSRGADDEPWQVEAFSEPGEFSAIGGLFSSVRSLATWVGGFVEAFASGGGGGGGAVHPLSAASRREMQQAHRSIVPGTSGDYLCGDESLAYGFGLALEADARFGECAAHSGGYPGYGSHMRWHAASGVGVIALANGRYADAQRVAKMAHRALLAANDVPKVVVSAWPATLAAHTRVRALLREWSDAECDALFACNCDMDEAREHRRARVAAAAAAVGGLLSGNASHVRCDTAAHMQWREAGERGYLLIEIEMTPEAEPRLQTFRVSPVTAKALPAELVYRALGRVDGDGVWPGTVLASAPVMARTTGVFRTARAIDGPFVWLGQQFASTSAFAGAWKLRGRAGEVWALRCVVSDEVVTAVELCPSDEPQPQ